MFLNQRARGYLHSFSAALSEAHGVTDVSNYFSLSDPKETQLRAALLESVDFLSMINVMDVDQLSGQVVNVGKSGLHTGRKKDGRFTRGVGVSGNEYKLVETDSCAVLKWDLLSVWANAGNENEFFQLVQEFSNLAFALDMLRIGFNGKEVADTTDPDKYPNGEDVNIGWHQLIKNSTDYKGQIITDAVTLDENGDYRSLDAMASDLINSKIPQQFRNDPRLVVLVGADLVAAEQYRLFQKADRPTEKIAAQMLDSTIAGRKAIVPPFMPGKRMTVTTLNNLHIYTQRNTRQRKAGFEDDRKQYENKYLRNEGYAVEEPELYAAIDEAAVTIGTVAEPANPPAGDEE
ncbi:MULTISPECIES: phage major capsid protein, P2 family [Pectobacterium]|uniref:Phage major capsid protein, P2 family n=1 Tax=Pectobacterium parvum TaxID=2778550 RepID=A0AAP9IHR7_9GAMM|nr:MULTISPECIES: phage major capsid protein, P2 family [Pectobacterium]PWD64931.1 phage major capsid protein, P2 family [Pectobacterium parmentieri]QHQ24925.1 phage major capsid protein, P2 family [Pectobacterium parvum]